MPRPKFRVGDTVRTISDIPYVPEGTEFEVTHVDGPHYHKATVAPHGLFYYKGNNHADGSFVLGGVWEKYLEKVDPPLADWERELLEASEQPVAEVDMVNHPSHYKSGGLEAIDVLEAFNLTRDGRLFNVGKYILRAGSKNDELEDLKKARWYLDRYISAQEATAQ